MLYIKFTKDYFKEFKEEEKFPKIINEIIYFWKRITRKFFKKKVDNGELIILPVMDKKTIKNLINYLQVYNIKTVCLSENLIGTEVEKNIDDLGIKILNGKWLYKYLIQNIVEYIVINKKEEIAEQEISILINQITEIDIENIMLLGEKCKNINIITENDIKLKKIEAYLYNEKGIILNITQNYSRSLIKSDIIINIDFEEEELNKYIVPRKAIYISLKDSTKILNKGFDGINIFSYKIIIPKKYVSQDLDNFNKEILYESYLYKNTNPKNIIKEINDDSIKIESLIGLNGEIKKNEFSRVHSNKNKMNYKN